MPWTIVHNGLTLDGAPFERRRSDDLVFVGRVTPEKGIVEAIEVALASGRHLKIAAKVGPTPHEQDYNRDVFEPALKRAGSAVEFLGELSGDDRDALMAHAHAVLMPGSWPEPFGLVAIEALACGAPVLARRVGGLDEIIRDGVDGFFGDDVTQLAFLVDRVEELDREAIRASVIDRFSATRMADGYEALYTRMVREGAATASPTGAPRLESRPDGRRPRERSAASTGPASRSPPSRVPSRRRSLASTRPRRGARHVPERTPMFTSGPSRQTTRRTAPAQRVPADSWSAKHVEAKPEAAPRPPRVMGACMAVGA